MKPSITQLFGTTSKPIAVLGGSPDLPIDICKLPANVKLMAVNEHAFKLGLNPDYYVFNNDPEKYPHLKIDTEAVKISKLEKYSDYLVDVEHFDKGFTGHFALWLASNITSGNIYLCGINCYGSEDIYFHKRKHERFEPLDRKKLQTALLEHWKLSRKKINRPERVYSFTHPLNTIYNGS